MASVTVRYWAAAKEAAGMREEKAEAKTLAEVLSAVRASRDGNERFAAVLSRSSFLVDSTQVGQRAHDTVLLSDGAVIEVLPAFAGG